MEPMEYDYFRLSQGLLAGGFPILFFLSYTYYYSCYYMAGSIDRYNQKESSFILYSHSGYRYKG